MPQPGAVVQTPRREVTTFPPRLDRSGASLPWARCSIATSDPSVKDCADHRAIATVAAVACSRAASAGFGRPARRRAIATQRANRLPGAGAAGGPRSVIGPPSMGSSAAGRRANATASACSKPAPPPHWPSRASQPSRARASAQRKFRKIFQGARATGRVATSCLSPRRARRCNTSVRPPAVRRYVASASVSSVSVSGAATGFDPSQYAAVHRRGPRVDVADYCAVLVGALSFPDQPRRRERAGQFSVPPFPFSELVGRDRA